MTGWRRYRALCALLLVAPLSAAAAEAPQGPRYVGRLDLPVESDRLGSPRSVAADVHTGEVFVADLHRDRVVIFAPDGTFRYQIRGGDVFRAPRDVAVDSQGFLYLAANRGTDEALFKLDYDGLLVTVIVFDGLEEVLAASGVGGEAGEAGRELGPLHVVSLAVSPAGDRLYLLDEGNKVLWLATTQGRMIAALDLTEGLSQNKARDLELGHVDVYGDTVMVAMASAGEIRLWDLEGESRGHVGFHGTAPCQLGFPVAAARDAGGDYLVIDQQRMLISRWSPVGNRCVGEHWGLGSLPGYLYFPFDLALGPEGRLYVSQGYEGRVQAYQAEKPAAVLAPVEDEEPAEAAGGGGAGP